ncbi:MAG: sugar porter family MFS transporter [Parachlamydiales bacterium]|nr:sugar porter family MFS transporter [Candidatus Acheromyda pituitae]
MRERFTGYTLFSVIVAAMGGFLFGYHTGIISGALIFLAPAFSLSPIDEGFVVSIILLGAIGGALISGTLADWLGRKKTILLTALIFILGATIISVSQTFFFLSIGRAVTGIAVGIISLTAPLYIAEISPPHYRGRFVSLSQLATTVGILAAYAVSLFYSHEGAWRMMFAVGVIPALVQIWALYFIPETPPWLLVKHQEKKAVAVMKKLRRDTEWEEHLSEMKRSAAPQKKGGWSALLHPKLRFVLLVGILLNCFQQITGINTVIYYAPKIFQVAGFGSAFGAILATLGVGIVNVVFSVAAVWLLDKVGRRPLLIWGVVGMVVSLLVLALAFFTESELIDLIAIVSLMTYVASFAIGLGPIPSLLLSEIYPLKIRGKAMTVGTMSNWFFNYLISLTFLDLMQHLGSAGTFCLYAAIGVVALWFFWRYIPETKGKSLEEIEASLSK